jgi:tetratricopeptide (TPR) repeat protein
MWIILFSFRLCFCYTKTKMAQKPKATVVTSKKRLSFSFAKYKKLIIAAVVLLVVAGGVWWWVDAHRKPEVVAPKQPSVAELNQAIGKYLANKDYDSAIRLLKSQPGNNSSTQKLLAGTYANAHDYKNALSTYESLDKGDNLSGDEAASAAQLAEQAHDFKTAVKYYKEAAVKVKAEKTPTYTDQMLMYQAKAKELEKKL